jgi:hypothetical protein
MPRIACSLIAFLALLSGTLSGADSGHDERWYVGDLNGQPAMSLHVVEAPRNDGGRTTTTAMALVIRRSLGGKDLRFDVRETNRFDEDASGALTAFQIERDENGTRILAQGAVDGDTITATVFRGGEATTVTLDGPGDVPLAGDRRLQEMLAAGGVTPGAVVRAAAPALVGAHLQLVTSTATCTGDEAGNARFDLVTDVLPVPATLVVDRAGDLVSMRMTLGPFAIAVRPCPGPPALLGGEVAPAQLVRAGGPAPAGTPVNRYRLPAGAVVPDDAFQRMRGDVVEVVAVPSGFADDATGPLLAAEPQLEIRDEGLRAWVDGILATLPGDASEAARAEALRLAVRSHITSKENGVGDGTARETFRSRAGDCTEHANLLCAALRIAGIPARVDIGLVFAADLGGWCGHAWNSAIIAGRWTHLDSAYPGQARSQYLRLGSSGGADAAAAKGTMAAMVGAMAGLLGRTVETLP